MPNAAVNIRRVRLEDLNVGEYQRAINADEVRAIAADFNPDAVGTITVGQRRDGSYWLIDGLQRSTAAGTKGYTHLRANVVSSRGAAHEAQLFRQLNHRREVSSGSKFNARCIERDPVALDIAKIVKSHGLEFTSKGGKNKGKTVGCYSRLERLYKQSPQHLNDVLGFLTDIWPECSEAMQDRFIGAASEFVMRASRNPNYDPDIAKRALATKNPSNLLGLYANDVAVGGRYSGVARAMCRIYDDKVRRSDRKLAPTWDN